MKIEQLDIPPSTIEFLQKNGYVSLYPPQEKTVKAGLLEGKSILVSAPTASGKTLIATLAIIRHLSEKRGKIVYLSPLKALASEKFNEFKKLGSVDIGKNLKIQRMYGKNLIECGRILLVIIFKMENGLLKLMMTHSYLLET